MLSRTTINFMIDTTANDTSDNDNTTTGNVDSTTTTSTTNKYNKNDNDIDNNNNNINQCKVSSKVPPEQNSLIRQPIFQP